MSQNQEKIPAPKQCIAVISPCDSTTLISWIIMLCLNPMADARG